MTEDRRYDNHPDAESLNAFAEEALSVREREDVMAHLAECGRCREIVFLAQEAAVEMEMESTPVAAVAASAPESNSAASKKSWFTNWRFAWVPAGALVAMASVAYVVHVRHLEMASQLAKAGLPPVIQNEKAAAGPNVAQVVRAPAPPPPSEQAGRKTKSPERAQSGGGPDKQFSSRSAAPDLQPTPAPAAQVESVIITPDSADQERVEQNAEAMKADQYAVSAKPKEKASELSKGDAVGRGIAASAAPANQSRASSSSGLVAGGQMMAGSLAAHKAKLTELPSGLVAASIAVAKQCSVAVDAKGAVFVREGSDGPWSAVSKQWEGQAVVVRLQERSGEAGAAALATVFELVNDQGVVWLSTDGRTWIRK